MSYPLFPYKYGFIVSTSKTAITWLDLAGEHITGENVVMYVNANTKERRIIYG